MPVKRPAEQAAESAVLVKNTYLAKCAKLTEEVCVGVYKGLLKKYICFRKKK